MNHAGARRFSLRPTPGGWTIVGLALTLLLAGGWFENNFLFFIGSTLLGLLIVSLAMARANVRGLRVERRVPFPLFAGTSFQNTIVIHNAKRFFPSVLLYALDHTGAGEAPPLPFFSSVPFISAGKKAETRQNGKFYKRGRKTFVSLEVSSRFPLGLFETVRFFDVANETLVYPRLGRIGRGALPEDSRKQSVNIVPVTAAQGEDEFAGLREYRPGDNPKYIHWKSSARCPGRLLVKEFEAVTIRRAIVAMEGRQLADNAVERGKLERAISYTAALLRELTRERYVTDFYLVAGGVSHYEIAPHDNSLYAAFAALAELVAVTGEERECPRIGRRRLGGQPLLYIRPETLKSGERTERTFKWTW